MSGAPTVEALHPDPERNSTRVNRERYWATRRALLDALSDAGEDGLRFSELADQVRSRAPSAAFEGASVSWHTTTVKLDLEARGLVARIPKAKPQRVRRTDLDEASADDKGL